jgi:hypothetical protein
MPDVKELEEKIGHLTEAINGMNYNAVRVTAVVMALMLENEDDLDRESMRAAMSEFCRGNAAVMDKLAENV